jgi:hypothetical protein
MNTTPTWQQDTSAKTDDWQLHIRDGTRCHVTQYEGRDDYCWQVYRNEAYQGGIVIGREAAIAKADEMLALPIEEYNALVADKLKAELREIERKLLKLQPDTDLLPGYNIGYEAGVIDTKRKIEAVLS